MTINDHDAGMLVVYDRACADLAEAVRVDEVKDIRDQAIAMAAYARQAKNHDAEANAVALRMRATRRLDQLRQAQKDAVGLARGGKPYQRKLTGVADTPVATLAMQGIDKNLAKAARKLGALSEDEFERTVAEARAAVTSAVAKVVKAISTPQEDEEDDGPGAAEKEITIEQWKAMVSSERRRECLDPKNFPSDAKFNRQSTDGIDWAQFSWNPIVGCNHACQIYCWAKDNTKRFPKSYPHGFAPVLRPRKLGAPYTRQCRPRPRRMGDSKMSSVSRWGICSGDGCRGSGLKRCLQWSGKTSNGIFCI
jgi:hypothetical protein